MYFPVLSQAHSGQKAAEVIMGTHTIVRVRCVCGGVGTHTIVWIGCVWRGVFVCVCVCVVHVHSGALAL